MRQIITDDFGEVRISGVALPGLLESLEISGEVEVDEIEVPGVSGTKKQPQGYNDAHLTLKLLTLTDDRSTCYEKAKQIIRIFKSTDLQAKPLVHRIVNKHAAMWGVEEVILNHLKTREGNQDDTMVVEIDMIEYEPTLVLKEAAVPMETGQAAEQTAETSPRPGRPAVDDDMVRRG